MADYPFHHTDIQWVRPKIDREILKRCTRRSDFKGLVHSLGVLAILAGSGALCYYLFTTGQWGWLALALYLHGALFAFKPQIHELSHNTVFKTRWLNRLFARVFGLVHWRSNHVRYWMSHRFHHKYTLHKESEAERVVPRPQTAQQLLASAVQVVDVTGFLTSLYDTVYTLVVPYRRNPRRSVWERYVWEQASEAERRNAYATHTYQFGAHLAFAAWAIATGNWFLVVIVTLPHWYGGRWYHQLVHDTMHVGRTPESNDFRESCRSVRVDPFTSFMYWHMEWHTEHHTFAAVPCYNLRKFHNLTREHWEEPQTLWQAWREMTESSRELLGIPATEAAHE
jgi:fatty acid desaturase